ncbi:hypothetical protein DND132_3381 [Pseudodesulfovibrio mercurii]|uniref:Uncharacterized protein n=1 Tax=Pseudodesulfovibrio mercurii TaxID=641491 RepID=F0JKY5_9BACT|nr:hypothetical protein [Pseudodesulfovibrio mercurii]EGB16584.1 hypothetical protein DND132_3381 [Pseudodesulfovibrio mercurii]
MNGEVILQATFFLGGLAVLILAWRMRRLNRKPRLPGVSWWATGYAAIGLAAIGVGADFYYGDWIKGFATHLLLTGGVAVVWMGTHLFLEGRPGRLAVSVSCALLAGEALGVFWFYYIDPAYQVRLTLTCVVLLILSANLSMTLFLSSMDNRAVTAAGVCYSLFALFNGLRTIAILIHPERLAYYLSGTLAVVVTALMPLSLVAAQVAALYMLRDAARQRTRKAD